MNVGNVDTDVMAPEATRLPPEPTATTPPMSGSPMRLPWQKPWPAALTPQLTVSLPALVVTTRSVLVELAGRPDRPASTNMFLRRRLMATVPVTPLPPVVASVADDQDC